MPMLGMLKMRLPDVKGKEQDALLLSLLDDAGAMICNMTWRSHVPEALKNAQVRLAAVLYSRLGVKHLAINLKRIRFIDSSGLGMLIGCYKYMQGRDGSMMLVEASKTVYRILELSGMKKLMPVLSGEQTK